MRVFTDSDIQSTCRECGKDTRSGISTAASTGIIVRTDLCLTCLKRLAIELENLLDA